jgi:hypothetical protein
MVHKIKLQITGMSKLFILSLVTVVLYGCDNDDNDDFVPVVVDEPVAEADPVMLEYEISVLNLTGGQPLSPITIVIHDDMYGIFSIGESASAGLELLAEGGDNADLLSEAGANAGVAGTGSGGGALPPGATEIITVSVDEAAAARTHLSLVSMLVNTNDALTASLDVDIMGLAVADSITMDTLSYDAGTEANTELTGTIPGPADGGEGFNAARDDIADEVRGHGGVVTADDGHMDSVLSQAHRWDNPVARVIITRTL